MSGQGENKMTTSGSFHSDGVVSETRNRKPNSKYVDENDDNALSRNVVTAKTASTKKRKKTSTKTSSKHKKSYYDKATLVA